jgi:hypothetical protein
VANDSAELIAPASAVADTASPAAAVDAGKAEAAGR